MSLTLSDVGWFNALENGVAGDGSTDDTSSINTLIADVLALSGSVGGVIYFPDYQIDSATPASYVLSGNILIDATSGQNSSISIVGAGWSAQTASGTQFNYIVPSNEDDSDIFTINANPGGGLYFASFTVNRLNYLQSNTSYKTTTTANFTIPSNGSNVTVHVTAATMIPVGSFVTITQSGGGLSMSGYLENKGISDTEWIVTNFSYDLSLSGTIDSDATVVMAGPTAVQRLTSAARRTCGSITSLRTATTAPF